LKTLRCQRSSAAAPLMLELLIVALTFELHARLECQLTDAHSQNLILIKVGRANQHIISQRRIGAMEFIIAANMTVALAVLAGVGADFYAGPPSG
jgi:hypothetical protein